MKILLVKEPSLLREGILTVLKSSFPEHEYCTAGSNEVEALFTDEKTADLLILDLDTNIDILSLVHYYKINEKKVVVWTSSFDNRHLTDLFQSNLNGYLFNGMEKDELTFAVKSVLAGKCYVSHELTKNLLNDYARAHNTKTNRPVGVFSRREWEVLEFLTKGLKNEEIAKTLFISDRTVKNHVSSILKKLDVPDRTNAVITAFRNRWFYV